MKEWCKFKLSRNIRRVFIFIINKHLNYFLIDNVLTFLKKKQFPFCYFKFHENKKKQIFFFQGSQDFFYEKAIKMFVINENKYSSNISR